LQVWRSSSFTYYGLISVSVGFNAGIKAFIAAVIGGVGSIFGSLIGDLLGLIEGIASGYVSSGYRDAISFSSLFWSSWFAGGLFGQAATQKM
jgi:branched-chain amino acid transport system permease protein